MLDFLLEGYGANIFVLRAMNERAQAWAAVMFGDFAKFDGGLVIEDRYLGHVRRTLPENGFVVSETMFAGSR